MDIQYTQLRAFVRATVLLSLAGALAACGSDSRSVVTLTLIAPEPDAELRITDDIDSAERGVQIEVVGTSAGLREGTPVDLYIDGEPEGSTALVDDTGAVAMPGVTLPPGEHRIHLATTLGTVMSDVEQIYTLRALLIEAPLPGATLMRDTNRDRPGMQITVVAQAYALDIDDDEVTLLVDGDEVATATLNRNGTATFTNVTVDPGRRRLRATVGSSSRGYESPEVSVTIADSTVECPDVSFVAPTAPSSGDLLVGGAACDEEGVARIDVAVSVTADDDVPVELLVNGEVVAESTVDDEGAAFENVVLDRANNNQLAVRVGGEGCETAFETNIDVDCVRPSCALRAPVPVEYEDAAGNLTLYLGAAQLAGDGFDVEVVAGAEAQGEPVALVLDGDVSGARTAAAQSVGGDVVARFDGVELSQGAHTVRARCRDALGNVTETPEIAFVVDTVACGVDITAPVAGTSVLPGDDTDNTTEGVQIVASAGVTGSDCVEQRVGVCNAAGELTGDFANFDGGATVMSTLTLGDPGEQHVCVELRDRAGNVGADRVAFSLRTAAPVVAITSPIDGASMSRLGGSGLLADANPETPLCDAVVSVTCETGADVVLHRNAADGPVLGMGECTAGQAEIEIVLGDGDGSATIVATQTVMGTSASITGASAPVTVATDCEPPVLLATQTPCSLHASGQLSMDEAASFVVLLTDSSADTVSAQLSYSHSDGSTMGELTGSVTGGATITFPATNLGGEGTVTVVASVDDDFGNRATYTCQAEIVNDLPSITVVTFPTEGQSFGPGGATCVPGDGGYGVQLAVTIDQAADREASLLINGVVVEDDLSIVGTSIAVCASLLDDDANTPPGPTQIELRVDSTTGPGFDRVVRNVSVSTLAITSPAPGALLGLAADCDPGAGFGVEVTFATDPVHSGAAYTLVGDGAALTGTIAAASITRCVPVTVGGERTFTVSLDGTPISSAVTVQVVDDVPEIVSLDAPLDGALFGVGGQTCSAGPGQYGVLVQATVDTVINRAADVRVNGVLVADDVTVAANPLLICVPVPDDRDNDGAPSTLTLELRATTAGGGVVSESVTLSVDTLDIVDPVTDQLLTLIDDCDPGTGYGYEVQLAVDAVHSGRAFTITGNAAPAMGVVTGETVTACVPLAPGFDIPITASIGGTAVAESVVVEVQGPPPAVTLTAPVDGADFGPGGQTCSAGAGNYGVRVQATVDQTADRSASIAVNGVTVLASAAIVDDAIDACVTVPDDLDHGGESTITVRVEEERGSRFDEASVTVSVDTLRFTSPVSSQTINPPDDCIDGPGFGYAVSIAVDAVHAGRSYSVTGNAGSLTGTVAGATITGCLPLVTGSPTLTASIGTTSVTDSVTVTVFAGGPPTNTVSFTRDCPDIGSASYRSDPIELSWGDLSLVQNYPGQFVDLALRCAHTPVSSAVTADAWWAEAAPVALPDGTTVASTSAELSYRVGEARFCALRAANDEGELSPVGAGTEVTCGFRSQRLYEGQIVTELAGIWIAPLGDVNGDGVDDVLIGGSSRLGLYFGGAPSFQTVPDVLFTGTANLGTRVAGLGDFNGDGANDFAIAHSSSLGTAGQVFVFFGRAAGDAWPATVDLTVTCGADLCLKHDGTGARLGNTLTAAGDFDGDGLMDLAATATNYPSDTNVGRFFIVNGGSYERRACGVPADCRATEDCTAGFCALQAGQTFWGLDFELPSGNWLNPPSGGPVPRLDGFMLEGVAGSVEGMGRGVAALGPFDSTAGDDLVVTAAGSASLSARLYFLSGRADAAGPGIDTLTLADLGFRSGGGVPSGTPFETTTRDTGNLIRAVGNVYDVPGASAPGVPDILVKRATENRFFIYPGDRNFLPSDRVIVTGPTGSDLGISLAAGLQPALPPNPAYPTPGVIGDLDGDGRSEIAAGANGTPGGIYLLYADALDSGIVSGTIGSAAASRIEPSALPGTQQRVVQVAGDFNDDGHPDFVVGNWQATTPAGTLSGEAYLLY